MIKTAYKNIPIIFLLTHLIFGYGYCLYAAWFTNTLGGDTLEHIHSSWLVYANFVPYKDFFQHHNPLLWFIFAPFVGLHAHGLDDNVITSGVVSFAITSSFIGYFYLYKITAEFLSNKQGGIIAAAIALTPYTVVANINFRPDNFMIASFFAGLYYYFNYLKTSKKKDLAISMVLFWCSFMFLQKILFPIIVLALITFYLLYKGSIKLEDMLYALVLPLVLTLAFVLYLAHYNILAVWYHSNFTANLYIPEIFAERRIGMFWKELNFLLAGSVCAMIFCWRKSSIYLKIILILWISEFLQRRFYFSAFAYYFFLLIGLSSILAATFLSQKVFTKHFPFIYVLCISLAICMYKPDVYQGNIGVRINRFYRPLNKEVVRMSTPCDYILNGDGSVYNLYNRDPHYYWNLLGQIDVIGEKAGIHPIMDINKVIENDKPQIIYNAPYKDKYAAERGIDINIHIPDAKLVNKYYVPLQNSEVLYILKPEYRRLKCDFDYKKRYYHAYD